MDAEQLAAADARFLDVGGERVHIRLAGPADGHPVVLIHGLAGSTFSWRRTEPALAGAGLRTLALDLRGFGLSDKSIGADHSLAAQAQLVADVMASLDIRRAALVGHSMGGSVALHVALSRPDLVDRLVLVNPWLPSAAGQPWPGELLRLPPIERWGRLIVRTLATPERVERVLAGIYSDPDDVASATAAGHLVPTGVRGWDEAVVAVVRDLGHRSLPGSLEAVRVPTLIVWGSDDPWLDPGRGKELREEIPQAELVLIAGAGHLPFEEQPERFSAELIRFLAGRPTV